MRPLPRRGFLRFVLYAAPSMATSPERGSTARGVVFRVIRFIQFSEDFNHV